MSKLLTAIVKTVRGEYYRIDVMNDQDYTLRVYQTDENGASLATKQSDAILEETFKAKTLTAKLNKVFERVGRLTKEFANGDR